MKEYIGKGYVVLHFWESWNRDEFDILPQLRTLYEKRLELQDFSSLLGLYRWFRLTGTAPLLRLLHRCFSAAERRNMLSTKPHIWVFQLYKLGYYATLNDAAKG